jgi:hypothetical protein
MADLQQAVCPLGDRRDLGAHRAAGAARCRRLRGAGLAGAGRYQCGPRPPACRRRPQGGLAPAASAAQQGLGRSRGGLSTKIQVVGDGRGRPLVTRATPGQTADTTALLGLVDAVKVARPGGIGRPRVRPNYLVADKAYNSRANRGCAPGALLIPSLSGTTSVPIGVGVAAREAVRWGSAASSIGAAIRSSGALTGANSCGRWRPATTSSNAATRRP